MSAVPVSPGPVGFITINVDPVLNLGPLPIHWYGVMYAVAFLAAYQFGVLPYAKRRGLPKSVAEKICVWTIIFGLLGGRLYYVVQQPNLWSNYILHPINIIAFWQGGMAFFGAIIVGFITLAICAWRYGYNPWIALDGGVLFAVVGQPIGRIGNVINGDILGSQSNLPWATAYSNPHAILQANFDLCTPLHCVAYQPAAVYEALGTIVIGIILWLLFRRNVRPGVLAIAYVALYAISQLILFEFRKSEPPGPLDLREAQWTSIATLVIGVPLLYLLWRRTHSHLEKRFPGSLAAAHDPESDQEPDADQDSTTGQEPAPVR
jgi:phosphatidylglycerol:prolipoprotein diacylglycerol transferase